MTSERRYDALIIGSGAGGCAAAYQLARAGLSVALLEKGGRLPLDGSTLDFNTVVHEGRFRSREQWRDAAGRRFSPEEYFNVGGKTKWYGAALLRYAEHEFAEEPAHQCAAWPITYRDLEPYYAEAERLLGVRTFGSEPDLTRIAERLVRRAPGWRHDPLPLGLSAHILEDAREARHFDGFASVADLKADAEAVFLAPALRSGRLTLLTESAVRELIGAPHDALRIEGARLEDGAVLRARAVLLAAGALHSPRLLERYLEERQLGARLPCAASVGRYVKFHLLSAMIAVSRARTTDVLRKTLLFSNAELPHSSVQPLGFDAELIATLLPALVPGVIARSVGRRAYGFFLQTEEGAHPDNRVMAASAVSPLPIIDYDSRRTPAAEQEHRRLVRSFARALAGLGMLAFSRRVGLAGSAHVSGTLRAGLAPESSVVDAQGRVHGMSALYVVDGSILPRSSRVNPSLTIYAWALRTAGKLAARLSEENAGIRERA